MAIVRVGGLTEIQSAVNSSSGSVTVPTDANLIMVVGVSGYQGSASYFSTAGQVTIGGAAMTALAIDASTSQFMGAMFYKAGPSTGSQTLAWNWLGSSAPANGVVIVYGFYSGVDQTTPVRDSDGVQDADMSAVTTKTLTAQSGDLIVAWLETYISSLAVVTWTAGASTVADFDLVLGYNSAGASWAEGSPSGDQAVSAGVTTSPDGGLGALVLVPAAVGPSIGATLSAGRRPAPGRPGPGLPGLARFNMKTGFGGSSPAGEVFTGNPKGRQSIAPNFSHSMDQRGDRSGR